MKKMNACAQPLISALPQGYINAPESPQIKMLYVFLPELQQYVRVVNVDAAKDANVCAIVRGM